MVGKAKAMRRIAEPVFAGFSFFSATHTDPSPAFFFYVIFMDSVVAVPSRVLLRVRLRATASDRPKRDVGCMTVIFFFFPFLSR